MRASRVARALAREFVVEVTMLPGGEKNEPEPGMVVTVTEAKSGRRVSSTDRDWWHERLGGAIESLVERYFPQSKTADLIRERDGKVAHPLRDGWQDNIGEAMHATLRKFCDSPASGALHDLITQLPEWAWDNVCASVVEALEGLPEEACWERQGKTIRDAWISALDKANCRVRVIAHTPRETLDSDEDRRMKDEMRPHALIKLADRLFVTKSMASYLEPQEWRAMLLFLGQDKNAGGDATAPGAANNRAMVEPTGAAKTNKCGENRQ